MSSAYLNDIVRGWLYFFTLASIFGHVGLIIYGKEKYLLVAAVFGAVINFFLNMVLIPKYMHQGAAVASLISECLITFLLVVVSMKCCKVKLLNQRLAALSAFCVALCIGSVLI